MNRGDCPLCLCPLEPHDNAHPLQCPSRHCTFNCCIECLEHMIKSTKEDNTSSDGNTFRVFLHCPNCRSNLGPSTRDTLLLRKVEKYSHEAFQNARKSAVGFEVVDVHLSASSLRLKHALEHDDSTSLAISEALQREDEFFGRGSVDPTEEDEVLSSSLGDNDLLVGTFSSGSIAKLRRCSCDETETGDEKGGSSDWSFDDEEGVEADLLTGPHSSFVFRHHSFENQARDDMAAGDEGWQLEGVEADATLLCGLDAFMTPTEQEFLTAQLISGNTARLATAAEMMYHVSALSLRGKPNLLRAKSLLRSNPSMKESIQRVIQEGREARRMEERRTSPEKSERSPGGRVEARLAPKRLANAQMRQQIDGQIDYMTNHPLPLRWPKYAEITMGKSNKATFLDDTWDGTVLDAFTKISVSTSLLGNVSVTKQHAESAGIHRIINAGATRHSKSSGKGYIDIPSPRVVVASIDREMGRQCVVKGDVVTHFNGEPYTGTARDLSNMIENGYEGEVLTLVFNADAAVAEALKRRALVSDGELVRPPSRSIVLSRQRHSFSEGCRDVQCSLSCPFAF